MTALSGVARLPDSWRRPGSRWPQAAVCAVIAAAVALALAATEATGGAIPQGDDWSYAKAAVLLHRTGAIRLQGWGEMFLLGQLFTAQPFLTVFGDRKIGLDVYGVVTAAIWLGCAFAVSRRIIGPRRALMLVVGLVLWPGFALISSSFMTDMPSSAASLLTVLLGIRAVQRQSWAWLAGCLVCGLWAFTIREQLVVAVAAVAVGALLARGVTRRFKTAAVVGALAVAVCCAVLEHLRHGLPHGDVAPFGLHSLSLSTLPPTLLPVVFTVGFALSPLAAWSLLSLRGKDWRQPGRLVGWVLAIVAIGIISRWNLTHVPEVVLGNYVQQTGGFSVAAVGYAPVVVGTALWRCVEIVACIAGIVVLGEVGALAQQPRRAWASLRSSNPTVCILATYTILLVAFIVGLSFAGQGQFDRYMVPVLPGVGALLLRQPLTTRPAMHGGGSRPAAIAAVALVGSLCGLLAVLSFDITVSTDERDATIWRVATALTRSGVPPTAINAGLNWDGAHSPVAADRPYEAQLLSHYHGQAWTNLFPGSTDCFIVSVSPYHVHGWKRVDLASAGPYGLSGGDVRVWAYHRSGCSP